MANLDTTNKLFIVIMLSIGVAVLGLQTPGILQQKGAKYDAKSSADLMSLKSSINAKAASNRYNLPQKLEDLSVSNDIKSRLSRYEYTPNLNGYKLCTVFKTDTTKPKSSAKTDEELKYSDYFSSSSTNDYYSHSAGRVCYEEKLSGYNSFSSTDDSYESDSSSSSVFDSYNGIQSKAKDTEIQTDINNIYSKLEEYYNENSGYPSLSQLKDASWRKTNMPGIDEEAFKGPNGEAIGSTGYIYTVSPSSCQNTTASPCNYYTLKAKLSTGLYHTKYSLN